MYQIQRGSQELNCGGDLESAAWDEQSRGVSSIVKGGSMSLCLC